MDRKQFLALGGTSFAAIIIAGCLEGCKKNNNATPNQPTVDFTLDLTNSANSVLNSNGGYVYSNGVIVARTLGGAYIAVSQACTHQGVTIIYQGSSNRFYCNAHNSSFANDGSVTGGPASSNLKSYTCTLSGTSLHVKG